MEVVADLIGCERESSDLAGLKTYENVLSVRVWILRISTSARDGYS